MIDLKTELKQELYFSLSGVPNYVIEAAIVRACYKFLNESLVWEEEQTLDACTDSVLVFANDPDLTTICSIRSVEDEFGHEIPFTWFGAKVHFENDLNKTVCVKMALTNNRGEQQALVPEWIYNQHSQAIIHATLYIIKSQEVNTWFSANGAAMHFNEYKRLLAEALIEKTPTSVQLNPFQ